MTYEVVIKDNIVIDMTIEFLERSNVFKSI